LSSEIAILLTPYQVRAGKEKTARTYYENKNTEKSGALDLNTDTRSHENFKMVDPNRQ